MISKMNTSHLISIIYFLSVHFSFSFALSSFITNYDTLNYQATHRITRRSVSVNLQSKMMRIKFQAFQKIFHLNIFNDYSVIHRNTEIVVNGIVRTNENVLAVKGFVSDYENSNVYGTLVDGIFRGVIKLDSNNATNGAYYVEHAAYHFDDYPGFHSIIYHDNDINTNAKNNRSNKDPHRCGWTEPDVIDKMRTLSSNHNGNYSFESNNSNTHSRTKRNANPKGTQYVCNLFLQSDTFLWNKIMSLHHVKGQHDLAVMEISSIFTQHVQGAQAIYQNTVFQAYGGHSKSFNGIGFRVDRVRINTTEDCEYPLKNNNPFCSPNIDVTNFLNLNSYMKHDDFCLAYVFTYRDFNGGTLGLAWVAEPGGSGGVCEKNRLMQEAGWNVQKSLNTGIVTLLNYGSYVALKVSQLTFAHEMGHNFGSKHDDDHKDRGECLPSVDDPKGNYIMFASATSGEKENNNKFSSCSRDSIARLLDRVTGSTNNCFLNQEGSFCGNKLREDSEQCDCGYSQKDCLDQCCHPKLSDKPCKLTSSVVIGNMMKKVVCSPNAGECCTKDCQFISHSQMCRSSGECFNAAHCTGNSTRCPISVKWPDLTKCQDSTRVCKNGECVGSICDSVPGWQECSVVRNEGVTPEMMCFVACKRNLTNSPCISTYELQKNLQLQIQYPELAKALIPDSKPIQLKSGSPCDNFHGYCDVFLRCRSVEADGPLARIKNMIFSSDMRNRIRTLVTQFWWAVMLMCIGAIVFIGLFLKLCSKRTPSTNPNARKRVNTANLAYNPTRSHRSAEHSSNNNHTSSHSNGDVIHTASSNHSRPVVRSHSRPHRHRGGRPTSMFQASQLETEQRVTRPVSMNLEASPLGLFSLVNQAPSYPPPAYESPLVLPRQHGRGRGSRGSRGRRLNQQVSRNL